MEARANRIAFLFVLPALTFMAGMLLAPLGIVMGQSVRDSAGAVTLAAYAELASGALFRKGLLTTLAITLTATALALLVAYPVAYHLALQPPRRRVLYSALVLLPFWTGILVKSFAFLVLFGDSGLVARAFRWVGVRPAPAMMFNRVGVMIGLVH